MTGHIPYLNTEYARNKDIECYDIESKGRAARAVEMCRYPKSVNANPDERPFDHNIPGTAPVTKGRRVV